MISEQANKIFDQAITDYHVHNLIDAQLKNPYSKHSLEHLLYLKCWIDTVQWHMEDEVRDPSIDPVKGLLWKRRIDQSNQERTDTVEYIDSYYLDKFKDVGPLPDATINTESPAWAIDRLSILALKIYHMQLEATRLSASPEHRSQCNAKLQVLLEQRADLSGSIDQLLDDISSGKKYMKVYKQMKMYNDPSLNPILYAEDPKV
ncbi:DUF4254 domain-containing protein [Olivibacter domesticus]|uniref:DUF4254 domain-containing protein n=1 Tax=Olivibacter domesticus TaxID=407022 RepID=A0A1H7LNA4_OLID1|nr:DUF4254 domain-containing protein [Olivibacter domesticus]SEL00472.1 Protein of unknown function [Olivibacter domesticus]